MERHELESRLRRTLATRAETVTASPDLWDRVAGDTVRRSPWRSSSRWAGLAVAAAAIVAAVVVVPGLLDRPDVPVIDQPVTRPTDAAPVTTGDGVRVVVGRDGENAIGGFGSLVEIDPATGDDRRTVHEGQPERDAPAYRSVAFRPDGSGELAELVMIEGVWDLRVRAAGAGDRYVGWTADPTVDATDDHRVAWTQDGAYLVWTTTPDDPSTVELRLLAMDLVDTDLDAPADAALATSQVLVPGWAPGAHVTDVVGVRGGELLVTAVVGGEPVGLLLEPSAGCTASSCEYTVGEQRPLSAATGADPKTILAVDSDANPGSFVGPSYALVALNTGRLGLTVGGDGDRLTALELPEDLAVDGAAAQDLWIDAAGEHVLVGRDGRAWLLRVELDADTPHVVDVAALEGERNVTGSVTVVGTAPDDLPTQASTEGTPDQGAMRRTVVAHDAAADTLVVSGDGLAEVVVPRPAGIDSDMSLGAVTIRPAAAGATEVTLLTQWCIGDGCTRAWTTIRDGVVVTNEVAPRDLQSGNGGGIMESTVDTPVFDASGDVLAWTEFNSDEQVYLVVIQDWRGDAPGAKFAVTVSPDFPEHQTRPLEVLAVTVLEDGIEVHTSAFTLDPPEAATLPLALRVTMAADVGDFAFFDAGTSVIDLPGLPRAGGSANGAGAGAVVVVEAEGGPLLVRLTDPTEMVELGSDVGQRPWVGVVPDGVVMRLVDGSFRQATLDGDTRSVELPTDTIATTGL